MEFPHLHTKIRALLAFSFKLPKIEIRALRKDSTERRAGMMKGIQSRSPYGLKEPWWRVLSVINEVYQLSAGKRAVDFLWEEGP